MNEHARARGFNAAEKYQSQFRRSKLSSRWGLSLYPWRKQTGSAANAGMSCSTMCWLSNC